MTQNVTRQQDRHRLLPLAAAALLLPFAAAQGPAAAIPDPGALGAVVDAPFTDLHWRQRRLEDLAAFGAPPAIVVYFVTIECPIVGRSLPRVGEVARQYTDRGVVTIVMNVGAGDGLIDAAAPVVEHAPDALFGKDFTHAFAAACGVERTNTAIVLDRDRKLRYRGRIDDSLDYSVALAQPTRADLVRAIEDVLSGRAVEVATTEVRGCKLTAPLPPDPKQAPDYAREIAPIVHRTCRSCHLHDAAGGISLASVADLRKHAAMVEEVVGNGRMPPWRAATLPTSSFLHRGLSGAARNSLRAWIAAGMPLSDTPAATPHPMKLEWRIGSASLVLDSPEAIAIPAAGVMPYQYVVLPHDFVEDTWIEALDVRSQQPRALQHCNVAIVPKDGGYQPSRFVTNYTQHGVALAFARGTALRIPAGSRLALQAYYMPFGRAVTDRLQVGIRFPGAVVHREAYVTTFGPEQMTIAPLARAHRLEARAELAVGVEGVSLFVHMHARGRDVIVTATPPGGVPERLLLIPAYDFAGQQTYAWQPGVRQFAPATALQAVAHVDNSAWNPGNPDPRQAVSRGPKVADEQFCVSLVWHATVGGDGIRVDAAGHRMRAEQGSPK